MGALLHSIFFVDAGGWGYRPAMAIVGGGEVFIIFPEWPIDSATTTKMYPKIHFTFVHCSQKMPIFGHKWTF